MKYLIKEIKKEANVEGKFGPQVRTEFTVEESDMTLSSFSKYPLKVGAEIEGTVTDKELGGVVYHNFKFTPKTFETAASPSYQPTADPLRLEKKIDSVMTEIQMIRGVLGEILQAVKPIQNEPF